MTRSFTCQRELRSAESPMWWRLLLGAPRKWYVYETKTSHDEPQSKGWVEVNGVKVKTTSVPEMVDIDVADEVLVANKDVIGDGWWLTYHFETKDGRRYMSGGSRSQRIALHRRLAEFFGGSVVYSDSNGKVNFRRKSPAWVGKDGDRAWRQMQLAIWNLKPLTKDECEACVKYAAYGK